MAVNIGFLAISGLNPRRYPNCSFHAIRVSSQELETETRLHAAKLLVPGSDAFYRVRSPRKSVGLIVRHAATDRGLYVWAIRLCIAVPVGSPSASSYC